MRSLVVAVLLVLAVPFPAAAQEPTACTETVDVGWEVDHATATVETAVVHAPGCEDGDLVGLQLQVDDGTWIPEAPLVVGVVDEHAHVDLSGRDVGMEPVVGVRVGLYGDALTELVEIVVDARFFNPAGNEQRGLRQVTDLDLEVGGRYVVPGAPARYADVPCASVGVEVDGAVAEGVGAFTATRAGRHVVCHQQQAGASQGPDDEEGVLGVQVERPGVVAAPSGSGDRTPVVGVLGVTGSNVVLLAVGGLAMTVVGGRLARRGRAR